APIRPQDNHRLRYRVHDLSQLSFRFSDFFKGDVQSAARAIPLNGDSGNMTRISNELYFCLARVANFTKVHAEGSQHLSVMPDDWVGPAGEEPCRDRFFPEMQPFAVREKISNKNGFSPIRGNATRSATGADYCFICRRTIRFRQVWSCRISHVHTVWLNEENRAKHPVAVSLN